MAETLDSDKLLYTQEEAAKMLDVCLKYFKKLSVPFVKIGKRKKYYKPDLIKYIEEQRKGLWQSTKGKGRPGGGTISPSTAKDFAEVQKQTTKRKQRG